MKTRILDQASWVPVQRLFALKWFRRVWVLQEVGLAASAIVLYGTRAINWSQIVEVILFWDGYPALKAAADLQAGPFVETFRCLWCSYDRPISWKAELAFVRQQVANQDKASSLNQFWNVLTCAMRYESSLGCDKIYAFLGHPAARYGTGTIVDVDYNRRGGEVCREVALKMMYHMNSLDILSFVHDIDRYVGIGPRTWTPRWDRRYDVEKFCRAPGSPQIFDVTRGLNPPSESAKLNSRPFQVSGDTLKVNGIIVDEATTWSMPLQSSSFLCTTGTRNSMGGRAINVLEKILDNVCTHCATSTSRYSDPIEACRLALTGGLDHTRQPAELDLVSFEADFYACVVEKCRAKVIERIKEYTKPRPDAKDGIETGNSAHFLQAVRVFTENRQFFITRSGYFGLGPATMHRGDRCCILVGAETPYVIRKSQTETGYELIGECYLQGIMKGEAIKSGQNRIEEINLV